MSGMMLQNVEGAKVCSAAGVATVKGKLASLNSLRNAITKSVQDAEKEVSEARKWDRLLLGAQLVKGVCDGIIGVVGEITGPVGKALKSGYKASSGLANAGARAATGQSVNWTKEAVSAGTNALGAAGSLAKGAKFAVGGDHRLSKELGDKLANRMNSPIVAAFEKKVVAGGITSERIAKLGETASTLKKAGTAAKVAKISTDPVIDALDTKSKDKGLGLRSFSTMMVDLGGLMADATGEVTGAAIKTSAGTIPLGNVYGATKDLIASGMAISAAIDDYKNNSAAGSVGSAVKSMKRQLIEVDKKIANLEKLLLDCEVASMPLRLA